MYIVEKYETKMCIFYLYKDVWVIILSKLCSRMNFKEICYAHYIAMIFTFYLENS